MIQPNHLWRWGGRPQADRRRKFCGSGGSSIFLGTDNLKRKMLMKAVWTLVVLFTSSPPLFQGYTKLGLFACSGNIQPLVDVECIVGICWTYSPGPWGPLRFKCHVHCKTRELLPLAEDSAQTRCPPWACNLHVNFAWCFFDHVKSFSVWLTILFFLATLHSCGTALNCMTSNVGVFVALPCS